MDKPLQGNPAFQLALSEAQYRAIGHMIAQWAFLESDINSEIKWLLGRSEHRGKRVNFQSRFSIRATKWGDLAKRTYRKHPKLFRAVQRIGGQATAIKGERDDIAHGRVLGSGDFLRIREGKLIEILNAAGQPSHIEDLACRISAINAALFKHRSAVEKCFRKRP